MTKKRAQAWSIDLFIATIIFALALAAFYFFMTNQENPQETLEKMKQDSKKISQDILSPGIPENWNEINVIIPGIISNNRINTSKLTTFDNLTSSNYLKTQTLFQTSFDWYLSFSENITLNGVEKQGIGKEPINPQTLLRTTRYIVYKDKPINIYLELWK